MRPEEPLKRFLNRPALSLRIAPETAESHAGIVRERSIGEDLSTHLRHNLSQVRDVCSMDRKARKTFPYAQQESARFGCLIQEVRQLKDLRAFETGALDSETRDGGGRIGTGVEARTNDRAACGRLRT